MDFLFRPNEAIANLSGENRDGILHRASLDLGKRAGSLVLAYPALLFCIFLGSGEIRWHADWLTPIALIMLAGSVARYLSAKRLARAPRAALPWNGTVTA